MPTEANGTADQAREDRFRVLIAGGGVAAVEALLALRELAGDRVDPLLFAPDPTFRFRPLSVTEPFELSAPHTLDLAEVALTHGGSFLEDGLVAVDSEARRVSTTAGRELGFDALLVAIGTRGAEAVPGAVTFRDSADRGAFAEVLADLDRGIIGRLGFVVPKGTSWPLGLYELALLTAARRRERGLDDVELCLVTPEARPLAVFGRRASAVVGRLLDRAGIELALGRRAVRFEEGRLETESGESITCDRAVALPAPEVGEIEGLPQDAGGFIPVDRYGAVHWVDRVFAAGDATWFPIKQGGLASQQADTAAASIAAMAGAPITPEPLRPVLRGALLTEWGPRYLRTEVGEDAGTAATSVLWWPPAKVAGRYLAPYLARAAGYEPPEGPLVDLEAPYGQDAGAVEEGHEDVVKLALTSAEGKARERDFRGALRWLEVVEDLELYLPREYELKRIAWTELGRSA